MLWRTLLTEPRAGADNMALDEALLARARGRPEFVMRVYAWAEPTLSIGRNQRAIGVYGGASNSRQVPLVRRLTGGRAVLHHREVTYSVTGPADRGDTLRASYATINQILLAALHRLGVAATLAARARQERFPPPASAPCFELPAPGEIVVGEHKLVGSAQLREHGAFLQHGSILIEDDQARLAEFLPAHVPLTSPAATLREALGRAPSLHEVAEALFSAVRDFRGAAALPLELDAILTQAADRARARYVDDSWTWRR